MKLSISTLCLFVLTTALAAVLDTREVPRITQYPNDNCEDDGSPDISTRNIQFDKCYPMGNVTRSVLLKSKPLAQANFLARTLSCKDDNADGRAYKEWVVEGGKGKCYNVITERIASLKFGLFGDGTLYNVEVPDRSPAAAEAVSAARQAVADAEARLQGAADSASAQQAVTDAKARLQELYDSLDY